MNWILKNSILLIIIVSILSRLPILLGENLQLDGDECIVGLMAKHLADGKEIPTFFYGQSYGFSLFEIIPISISYFFFGVSQIAVKIAMLCVWTIGIVFFYKTLKEIGHEQNKWAPLLITLIFIFMPSFALWSMKARGGYITAFLLSSIVIYFLLNKKWVNSLIISFLIGLSLTIIYQSQALWLAGIIPIIGYVVFKKKVKYNISLASGILSGTLIFSLLKSSLPTIWSPVVLSTAYFNEKTLLSISEQVYYNLTGSYIYSTIVETDLITKILAFIFMILIFSILNIGIFNFLKRIKLNPLFYIACLSVLFTIGYLAFMNINNYRYLLPISGFALLMIYMFIININHKKIVNSFLVLIIFLGTFSIYNFKNYSYDNIYTKLSLIENLKERDIEYVYCEDGLLQWEIMFYSNESIIARFVAKTDRYPKYIKQVNDALENSNVNTALVGNYNEELIKSSKNYIPVNNKYFIYKNPSKTLLIERGFNLDKI